MAKKHWIQDAIKRPGALRLALHVPSGKLIPASRLKKASKGNSKTARRARLAITLKKMHHR